jgi:hypothetical protein
MAAADAPVVLDMVRDLAVQTDELVRQLTDHRIARYGRGALDVIRQFVQSVRDGSVRLQPVIRGDIFSGLCYRHVAVLSPALTEGDLLETAVVATDLMRTHGYRFVYSPTGQSSGQYPPAKKDSYCFRVDVVV